MDILGLNEKGGWNVLEVNLGLILTGETKSFDLPFCNSGLIRKLTLSATTSGLFNLTIYNRQTKDVQDLVWYQDSSETSQIIRDDKLLYDDMDKQRQLYIKIVNGSAADMQFSLVVKYD